MDEVHHLLAGSMREQRQSMNQLKFLSNDLRMPVVALKTSEALYAMQPEQAELDRLRKEVAKLKMERDILKKAREA